MAQSSRERASGQNVASATLKGPLNQPPASEAHGREVNPEPESKPVALKSRCRSLSATLTLMPHQGAACHPITADGSLGMFVGHTFIVTETGRDCVDDWPIELTVVKP